MKAALDDRLDGYYYSEELESGAVQPELVGKICLIDAEGVANQDII